MKKIAIIMMLLIVGIGITSSTKDKENPVIEFVSRTHDFGTIKETKGPVTCKFAFTNKGNAPLVIVSATAGCGCTKPAFEGEPIAAGKKSEITVTYNPKGRLGEFNKTVTVRTNDPKNKKVTLKISGVVVP